MKMAMKDGMIRIIEADVTQAAIIKSWGKMKYSRSNQMYEGPVSMELLNKLAGLVRLPPAIEAVRKNMNKVQVAVDQERVRKDPSLSRIHRIGQRNVCTYIDLEVDKTIDELISKSLAKKEDMAKTVVDNWRDFF